MALPYKYFRFPFAITGDVAAVPDTVQIDGSVSYPQGFGPDYALDPATQPAALNIPRQQSNQIYLDVTQGMKYMQEGAVSAFIAAADNGGAALPYTFLALVLFTDGYIYQSVAAANTGVPGASANWVRTRIRVGANTTFYVATTGNNSNSGLVVGSPFLTLQFANDNIAKNYDPNGFILTVQVADGAYAAGVASSGPFVGSAGAASMIFNGNSVTPANVIIHGAIGFRATEGARITVQNMKMNGNTECLQADFGGEIQFGGIVFDTAGQYHILASRAGVVKCIANYSIIGGGDAHMAAAIGAGLVEVGTFTVTLTGTPPFVSGFAFAKSGNIIGSTTTYTGAATGPRYSSVNNGIIDTAAGGASYYPGNSAGSTNTGGVYV